VSRRHSLATFGRGDLFEPLISRVTSPLFDTGARILWMVVVEFRRAQDEVHTVTFRLFSNECRVLFGFLISQAMVKIPNDMKEIIDHYHLPSNFAQKTRYAEDLHQLHQMGLIVESDEEDHQKLKSFRTSAGPFLFLLAAGFMPVMPAEIWFVWM